MTTTRSKTCDRTWLAFLVFAGLLACWGIITCNPALGHQRTVAGIASWYGPGFYGNLTANGEVYTGDSLTAATTKLPLNVCARVTRTDDGSSIVVWLNDRGPYVEGRVLDLSRAAAVHLGIIDTGLAPVLVSVVPCETEKEVCHDSE